MEAVPRGANFARIKMLWEIGVHVAAAPSVRATNSVGTPMTSAARQQSRNVHYGRQRLRR